MSDNFRLTPLATGLLRNKIFMSIIKSYPFKTMWFTPVAFLLAELLFNKTSVDFISLLNLNVQKMSQFCLILTTLKDM